jgi:HlyD family secretion protein
MKKLILIVFLLAVVGSAGGWYYMRKNTKEPEVRTAPITRGDVVQAVQATGTLEAVTTVQVGTQVGGIVQDLNADFNDFVKKGQVIARLDPTILDTQIEQQRANVTRAEADLERLKVSLADAKQKFERAKALSDKNLLPRTDFETAQVNVDSAQAQIRSSEAALVQAKSQLHTAEVNREHTVITAPIDGIVIQRSVERGQTVNAGMSAPTLYILAADLTKMQINANIDEADVGTMRTGQHVTFRVDAFPNETFSGTVQQVRLQPTTVQNVVTYQTVINVPNEQFKLKPGMTANVTIEITRKSNVLRMPLAASRFRPTAEVFAALKQEPPADFGRGGVGGRGRNAGGTGGGGQGGFPGSGQPGAATAPTTGGAPAAAGTGTQGSKPTQQATVTPQGSQSTGQGQGQSRRQRQGEGSPAAQGGGDRMAANGTPDGGAQGGTGAGGRGGFNGGGRGGFDPNMTPEERRKRMEERMASMTPEERAAFQERMAQRQAQGGGRGGFGGGQGQGGFGGAQGQAGGRAGGGTPAQGNGGNPQANANRQSGTNPAATRAGRADSAPATATSATTIDSLFGPLPAVETRGQAWLYENKQLKQVRMRLGVSDGTNVEIIDANPEVKEGSEVVTNVIIETAQGTTPGQNNNNNPLLGPQRGRGGPGGGFGGPGGGGGGGGRGGR